MNINDYNFLLTKAEELLKHHGCFASAVDVRNAIDFIKRLDSNNKDLLFDIKSLERELDEVYRYNAYSNE